MTFSGVSGAQLASCAVKTGVAFDGCSSAKVVGNTFDYQDGLYSLQFQNCTSTTVRNNIFWNSAGQTGMTWAGGAPDSDHNCYYPYPTTPDPNEPNSVYDIAPEVDGTDYFVTTDTSPVINAGISLTDFTADLNGHCRDSGAPSIGAVEFHTTSSTAGSSGRVTSRTIAGNSYTLGYDALGRMVSYSDGTTTASAEFDHLCRRTKLTVGNTVYRFVYDGDDVVAELVDEDGDGTVDRKRLYWILPVIDQRIGFVDIDVGSGDADFYYYVADQVGSVLQVIDDSGAVVNQYDYDAFGNLVAENSWEGVENRYRFQGREWDDHLQAYYFRYRTYFPETGTFGGMDMDIRLEVQGPGNYLFDPRFTDPYGLMAWYDVAIQSVSDFSAGMADKITFGGTRTIRDNTGMGYTLYRSGSSYKVGEAAGIVHSGATMVAGGFAVRGAAQAAAAAGGKRAVATFAAKAGASIAAPQAAQVGVNAGLNAAANRGIISHKTAQTAGAATAVGAEITSAVLGLKAIRTAKGLTAEKPPVIGETRPYDQAKAHRYAGYDDHHLDPRFSRADPTYKDGPTIPVRNDNAGGKVPGGKNYHQSGLHPAFNKHIKELGYTRTEWDALPDETRLIHLRRYYGSLGIRFDK